jgi:hypothetical protein
MRVQSPTRVLVPLPIYKFSVHNVRMFTVGRTPISIYICIASIILNASPSPVRASEGGPQVALALLDLEVSSGAQQWLFAQTAKPALCMA